jgi:hypothetical protein
MCWRQVFLSAAKKGGDRLNVGGCYLVISINSTTPKRVYWKGGKYDRIGTYCDGLGG